MYFLISVDTVGMKDFQWMHINELEIQLADFQNSTGFIYLLA